MIKFIEKVFSIPVVIVLEALLLVMRLAKIVSGVINSMLTSGCVALECNIERLAPTKEDQNKNDGGKN